MTVLVVHAGEQSGAGMAGVIAAGLEARGISAEAVPVEGVAGHRRYDALVIGAPYGHLLPPIKQAIAANCSTVDPRPVWVLCPGQPMDLPGAESGTVHAVHPPQGDFSDWLDAFAGEIARPVASVRDRSGASPRGSGPLALPRRRDKRKGCSDHESSSRPRAGFPMTSRSLRTGA